MPPRLTLLAAALLLLLLPAAPALAHPTHNGTVVAHVRPDDRAVDLLIGLIIEDLNTHLRLDQDGNNIADPQEVEAAQQRILTYVQDHARLDNDGAPCAVAQRRIAQIERDDPRARVHTWLELRCEQPLTTLRFTIDALFEDEGGYRHYGRIQLGDRITNAAFNNEFPTYTLEVAPRTSPPGDAPAPTPPPPSTLQTLLFYAWEGVLHILLGYDHVLFVLALLLVARRFKNLAATITAFTVGHSVTLILAALDVVTLSPALVEPIIALSIAWVAVENLLRPDEEPRYRFLVTGLFGLIHGFGFSYVLRDDVGLPSDALLPALLAFNGGVELGQLAVIALAWPLLRLLMRSPRYRAFVLGGSALILLLALTWLVQRTLLA